MTIALAIGAPARAAEQTVRSAGVFFLPPIVVAAGSDTITLDNLDPLLQHTFTTEAQICPGPHNAHIACNTGVVTPGSPRSVVLSADPGTYDFFCQIHGGFGMVGRLVVQ